PLIERKTYLTQELDKRNLNYTFIECYDKEVLTNEQLSKFDHKLSQKRGTCSLFIKQLHTMQLISQSKYKYNLIFEDDVILSNNFANYLERGLRQLPNNYDMLFIGDGCNLHIPSSQVVNGQYIYEKCREPTRQGGNGATRCTDSMLLSKSCCTKLVELFNRHKTPIHLPLDFWLNIAIRELKLNIYWMEPTIVTQGTENGKYKTSH
ncbi:unnamed protein product, partial [marine sediment metagenome]